ncbi:hypothetical protein [Brazilian marseillevirus]|uniref:hypothetical protein n=1 Tax=Brazilian marseillevirus TaxID=1813599 RepID=UPI0007810B78|nr:hypothetical protein A3303_gp447 [Brazilian marseillevirus]AMQ10955.1 hypothetical protein [Brazilian marseillevirus]
MQLVQLTAYGCFDCYELHVVHGEERSCHAIVSFSCKDAENMVQILSSKFQRSGELDQTAFLFMEECRALVRENTERENANDLEALKKYEGKKMTNKRNGKIRALIEAIQVRKDEESLSLGSFWCK